MDAFTIAWQLAVIALLVALNGFFVAAEFTIVKVRPSQLEELIADGNRQARYAKTLVDHMDVSLSVTQLGITLVSLGLGWVGEPYLAAMLRPGLAAIGVTGGAVDTIAFAVAFSLITAAHIILGELAPKNISIVKPLPVLLGISLPLLLFQRLTYPFVWLLNTIANHTVRFFGYEPEAETTDAHSEDEIRILMAESRKHGFIGSRIRVRRRLVISAATRQTKHRSQHQCTDKNPSEHKKMSSFRVARIISKKFPRATKSLASKQKRGTFALNGRV